MEKKHLYILAGLIWGIPGVILSVKGINAYQIRISQINSNSLHLDDQFLPVQVNSQAILYRPARIADCHDI